MRHVPIAEFKDRLSEMVAAVAEEGAISITRHGREVARLIPPEMDVVERRRQAFTALASVRNEMKAEGIPATTRAEIADWIAEGRNRG
ncbi:prevent-host-death family protein [Sphingomonas jinjuensis]|uniref:Antitoxin n=2 Tax=Sphingomonas jinjuensis TaxID=535907 RepID=A0A840F3J7_9SPHN|nr:prevent-host-death family protein [Sphingomonas jinjuensis]